MKDSDNNTTLPEIINTIDFGNNNEDLNDYYDNFYN